jgi:hypothetical protein
MVIDVELVDRCTPEIVEAFCRDEPRLSSRPSRLKPEVLADMIASPAYQLLVARIDGVLHATLTLAVYRAPSGIKANVGDVVAEQTEQGQSAAAALVEEAGGHLTTATNEPAHSGDQPVPDPHAHRCGTVSSTNGSSPAPARRRSGPWRRGRASASANAWRARRAGGTATAQPGSGGGARPVTGAKVGIITAGGGSYSRLVPHWRGPAGDAGTPSSASLTVHGVARPQFAWRSSLQTGLIVGLAAATPGSVHRRRLGRCR